MSPPRLKAWVDPQVTRHTLHLGETKPVRLHSDKQALLVQPEGSAAARVPLARIERIISGPLAEWTGAALAACADAHIGVAFAGRNGMACASLAPFQETSGRLDAELTLFAESPNAETAWRDGVRGLRSRLLNDMWHNNHCPPEGQLWEEQRRSFVYQGSQLARHSLGVTAHSHAAVCAQLHREGLQRRYPTRGGRWIEIACDLSAALHDLRALMSPLEQAARISPKLRAEAIEASEAAHADTISWCVLILRRSTHEHLKPWL